MVSCPAPGNKSRQLLTPIRVRHSVQFGGTQLEKGTLPMPDLVPMPVSVVPLESDESDPTGVAFASPLVQALAEKLAQPLQVWVAESSGAELSDESYRLQVNQDGVQIVAPSELGALRGLATVSQLHTTGWLTQPSRPALRIEDAPRFGWRGLLLDPARHFLPIETLLKVVEGMWLLKLNVLHLHLSDDQGFRLNLVGFEQLASAHSYSEQDIARLVDHAAQHGVRVVPEIDVPGHVTHMLVAYPHLAPRSCVDSLAPTERFGVHPGCLDPSRESTYEFLERLLARVAHLFPDDYLHVGGDEVSPGWWQNDPDIQAFMAQRDLQDVGQLQNYFLGRVGEIVEGLGRRMLAWDEVLCTDMPYTVVQNWRGATTRNRAIKNNLPCVVSSGYYLDLHYPSSYHYGFDPGAAESDLLAYEDTWQRQFCMSHVAEGVEWTKPWREGAMGDLDTMTSDLIWGGEACLWGELVDNDTLPIRLWSRLPAVAERLWSLAECNSWEDFNRRWQSLKDHAPFELRARQTNQLTRLSGLTQAQAETAAWLQPALWYWRLLGQQTLQARLQGTELPQGRPYTVHTPLKKAVNFLSPDSSQALSLIDADKAHWLHCAKNWAQIPAAGWPEDMVLAVNALRHLGQHI